LLNSSSSHSIVFFDDEFLRDIQDNSLYCNDYLGDGIYYAGDNFVLCSDSEKKKYLAALLSSEYRHIVKRDVISLILKDYLGLDIHGDVDIDHGSLVSIPRKCGSVLPNKEFFNEFLEFLLLPNVVILGGSDNSDEHFLLKKGRKIKMCFAYDASQSVARKDEKGFWIVFGQDSGSQIIFAFSDNRKGNSEHKIDYFSEDRKKDLQTTLPIGIDLKITNFCSKGCEYCYQDSSIQGEHGHVFRFIDLLAKMEIFEVAIGGGEPLEHPDFFYMIEQFREKDIVPNFTTRDIFWVHDSVLRDTISKNVGRLAISIDGRTNIKRITTMLEFYRFPIEKIALQVTMGTLSRYSFLDILMACKKYDVLLSLVGYKRYGRGKDFKIEKYDWWLDIVDKVRKGGGMTDIVIDTVLAKEYEDEIKKRDIPHWCFNTEEGKYNCYVDLVEMKMAKCSYTDEKIDLPDFGFGDDEFIAEFKKIYRGFYDDEK